MYQCLICQNKTDRNLDYQSICSGCLTLLSHTTHSCKQCGIELQAKQTICGTCQSSPPAFTSTYYACTYQAPIDKWVMSLKFGKKIIMSRLFAELLQPKLKHMGQNYILMPVPLHVSRLRSRGYNQAYEIAKELAKLSARKLDTSLKRSKNTAMQAQLSLKQRAKNVSKAFNVKEKFKFKSIILVDDVMTTGNTLNECAKTLLKAGAEDVQVLVFARKFL